MVLYYGPILKDLLKQTSEMNLSAGGVGLRLKMELAAALAAAQVSRAAGDTAVGDTDASEIASLVDEVAAPAAVRQLAGARVLWADDNPANELFQLVSGAIQGTVWVTSS